MAASDSTRKVCTKCGLQKSLESYAKAKLGKHGRSARCRDCAKIETAAYRSRPGYKERHAKVTKEWYLKRRVLRSDMPGWIPFEERTDRKCGACLIVKPLADFGADRKGIFGKGHACRECIRSKSSKWYAENSDRAAATNSAWRSRNMEKVRSYSKARAMREKAGMPQCIFKRRIRTAVGRSLRGRRPVGAFRYLPFGFEELMAHLERQFVRGMSWENYGEWHVDHVVPLAQFGDMAIGTASFQRAWALTNLRPLWAKDNLRKKDKRLFLI